MNRTNVGTKIYGAKGEHLFTQWPWDEDRVSADVLRAIAHEGMEHALNGEPRAVYLPRGRVGYSLLGEIDRAIDRADSKLEQVKVCASLLYGLAEMGDYRP